MSVSVLVAPCGTARQKLELFFDLFQGTALRLSHVDVVEALSSIHHVFQQQLHDSTVASYLAVLLPGSSAANGVFTVGQCVDAICAQQLVVEALRLQVILRALLFRSCACATAAAATRALC